MTGRAFGQPIVPQRFDPFRPSRGRASQGILGGHCTPVQCFFRTIRYTPHVPAGTPHLTRCGPSRSTDTTPRTRQTPCTIRYTPRIMPNPLTPCAPSFYGLAPPMQYPQPSHEAVERARWGSGLRGRFLRAPIPCAAGGTVIPCRRSPRSNVLSLGSTGEAPDRDGARGKRVVRASVQGLPEAIPVRA